MKRIASCCYICVCCIAALIIGAGRNVEPDEAVRLSKTVISDTMRETILNDDAPSVREMQIHGDYPHRVIPPFGNGFKDIAGRRVWAVVYSTIHDPALGPLVIYVDYYTGEIYGFEGRL